VVATRGFSNHNCATKKFLKKQIEGKIKFQTQLGSKGQKSRDTREQLKCCETRRSLIPADILVYNS